MSSANGHGRLMQQRLVTALHESSHCVAAWLLGQPVARVYVREAAAIRAGEPAGQVISPDRPGPLSLTDAVAEIQVYLSGEAGARVAIMAESPEQAKAVYGVLLAEFEPSLEDVAELPSSSGRVEQAVHFGWAQGGDGCASDIENAERLAEHVTTSAFEALALMRWLRIRTAATAATPKFQKLVQALTPPLLAEGELSGDVVDRWLTVAADQFESTKEA